jgi:hypothetical protein
MAVAPEVNGIVEIAGPEKVRMSELMARFLKAKRRMTQCFCHLARTQPKTTHDNFVRDFGERFIPGYKAPSSVDMIMNAPFGE